MKTLSTVHRIPRLFHSLAVTAVFTLSLVAQANDVSTVVGGRGHCAAQEIFDALQSGGADLKEQYGLFTSYSTSHISAEKFTHMAFSQFQIQFPHSEPAPQEFEEGILVIRGAGAQELFAMMKSSGLFQIKAFTSGEELFGDYIRCTHTRSKGGDTQCEVELTAKDLPH